MKMLLLGILLGLLLHKGVNYTYDFQFEKAFMSDNCKDIMLSGGNLSERFACTYKEMGVYNYLAYILMRPNARNTFDRETWIF